MVPRRSDPSRRTNIPGMPRVSLGSVQVPPSPPWTWQARASFRQPALVREKHSQRAPTPSFAQRRRVSAVAYGAIRCGPHESRPLPTCVRSPSPAGRGAAWLFDGTNLTATLRRPGGPHALGASCAVFPCGW